MNTAKNKSFSQMARLMWCICASFIMMTGQLSAVPRSAKVEIDAVGNAIAIWELQEASSKVIQGAYCLASSNIWSTPQQLSPIDTNSMDPKFAINSSGQTVVIWRSIDSARPISSLYAATISLQDTPVWTRAVLLTDPSQSILSVYVEAPYSVKINENGKAIALWQTALLEYNSAISIVDGTNTWSSPINVVNSSSKARV